MKRKIIRISFLYFILSLIWITPCQEVMAAGNVQILLKNMGVRKSPLVEYSDPIDYAVEYSKSISGAVDNFLVNWNISSVVTGKNEKWQMSDEQALLSILADESIIKSYLKKKPEKFVQTVNKSVSTLSKAINSKLLKNAKTAGKVDKWMTSALKDSLKLTLQNSQAKMDILALIAANTEDENLKAACNNCMNTVFTNTLNTIKTSILNRLISVGIRKSEAATMVTNQILMTPMKSLMKTSIKALGECAKGVSYALVVLDVKDLLTYISGIQTKTSAYMSIVSYETIYNGARGAFQKAVKQYRRGDAKQENIVEALFQVMLKARQNAYNNLPKMLGDSKWKQALRSNSKLKQHNKTISEITIKNYNKKKEQKASIKLNQSAITIYLPDKTSVKLKATVTGKSKKVTWKSSDKKIATINSNGKVRVKRRGTVKITATANGKSAKCKITIKKRKQDASKTGIDVSKYFHLSMSQAAQKLNMLSSDWIMGSGGCRVTHGSAMDYRNGSWIKCYAIGLWCPQGKQNINGAWRIEGIYSKDYNIFGIKVGMDYSSCKKILKRKGYFYNERNSFSVGNTSFQRYGKGEREIRLTIRDDKCTSLSYYP